MTDTAITSVRTAPEPAPVAQTLRVREPGKWKLRRPQMALQVSKAVLVRLLGHGAGGSRYARAQGPGLGTRGEGPSDMGKSWWPEPSATERGSPAEARLGRPCDSREPHPLGARCRLPARGPASAGSGGGSRRWFGTRAPGWMTTCHSRRAPRFRGPPSPTDGQDEGASRLGRSDQSVGYPLRGPSPHDFLSRNPLDRGLLCGDLSAPPPLVCRLATVTGCRPVAHCPLPSAQDPGHTRISRLQCGRITTVSARQYPREWCTTSRRRICYQM